jgi:hypothetical protein
MNRFLFITLLVLSTCTFTIAQPPKPSKSETIAYLNKKINEAVGHSYIKQTTAVNSYDYGLLTHAQVQAHVKGIVIQIQYKTANAEYITFSAFDPAAITEISIDSNISASPLNAIDIKLSGRSCVEIFGMQDPKSTAPFTLAKGYQTESVEDLTFVFLRTDGENFEKIKKALLHLRSLAKSEADPFGSR